MIQTDESSPYDQALRRCARNILDSHANMLVSAERQVDELSRAMLRVANAIEQQKPGPLAFQLRRPRQRRLLWWKRPAEEKDEIESEFVAITTGELKWAITLCVEADPAGHEPAEWCHTCSPRRRVNGEWLITQRYHPDLPRRSRTTAARIAYLLDAARRCIHALEMRSADRLHLSPLGTLSFDAPGDLNDQIAAGRVLAKRIVHELRAAADRGQRGDLA